MKIIIEMASFFGMSIFEPHTDIIVKGFREVQYGHKINLSSEKRGFITCLSIEKGNPSDKDLFISVLDFHQSKLGQLPSSVVADGGFASQANVAKGRALGKLLRQLDTSTRGHGIEGLSLTIYLRIAKYS